MSDDDPLSDAQELEIQAMINKAARDEVAALAGLFLRRLQEIPHDSPEWLAETKRIWGEALNDFGKNE